MLGGSVVLIVENDSKSVSFCPGTDFEGEVVILTAKSGRLMVKVVVLMAKVVVLMAKVVVLMTKVVDFDGKSGRLTAKWSILTAKVVVLMERVFHFDGKSGPFCPGTYNSYSLHPAALTK